MAKVNTYETQVATLIGSLTKIGAIYNKFITDISNASDVKYNSKAGTQIKLDIKAPDLTDLKKSLSTLPRLEAVSAIEYISIINNLAEV